MNVVLLDRDGTVIVDPPDMRVDSVEEIELFPDTIEALKLLVDHGFAAVFVTNQAGIAEGRYSVAEYEVIQAKVIELLQPSGIEILHTYMCPHGPDDGCVCRKPSPVLLQQAIADYQLDPTQAFMVGDRLSDIEAGIAAGTQTILVKTGLVPVDAPMATHTAATLFDAARIIVANAGVGNA